MGLNSLNRWVLTGAGVLGLAAMIGGCAMTESKHDKWKDKEENEVKVKFDDAPAAVKATFTKEAAGVAIAEVDKETDDGKTIYEADAKIGGTNYEIKVAEDGTLISKKVDKEDDEKKDGEEKKDGKTEGKMDKD